MHQRNSYPAKTRYSENIIDICMLISICTKNMLTKLKNHGTQTYNKNKNDLNYSHHKKNTMTDIKTYIRSRYIEKYHISAGMTSYL